MKSMQKNLFSNEDKEDQDEGDSSWFCALCTKEKEEDMIQCMNCKLWVHTKCANVKPSIKNICVQIASRLYNHL